MRSKVVGRILYRAWSGRASVHLPLNTLVGGYVRQPRFFSIPAKDLEYDSSVACQMGATDNMITCVV
jgi:hypothetical protein